MESEWREKSPNPSIDMRSKFICGENFCQLKN